MTPEQQARQEETAYERIDRYIQRRVERAHEVGTREAIRGAIYGLVAHYDKLGKADRRRMLAMLVTDAVSARRMLLSTMAAEDAGDEERSEQ